MFTVGMEKVSNVASIYEKIPRIIISNDARYYFWPRRVLNANSFSGQSVFFLLVFAQVQDIADIGGGIRQGKLR